MIKKFITSVWEYLGILFIFSCPAFAVGACPGNELATAIGCIPTDNINVFVATLLRFGIGIGGGIALLLMAFGAIRVTASGGDPKAVQAGKELIEAALGGLIFIIFSLFLLKFIGVNVLGIPNFG